MLEVVLKLQQTIYLKFQSSVHSHNLLPKAKGTQVDRRSHSCHFLIEGAFHECSHTTQSHSYLPLWIWMPPSMLSALCSLEIHQDPPRKSPEIAALRYIVLKIYYHSNYDEGN